MHIAGILDLPNNIRMANPIKKNQGEVFYAQQHGGGESQKKPPYSEQWLREVKKALDQELSATASWRV